MPPRPRPVQRRLSSAKDGNINTLHKTPNPQAMPPPPVPASVPSMPPPPPPPQGILVPEATALSDCLRSAVVKTGQIYRFYADTKKLGVHRHAPYPPRALVSSLGREVEKYGQLCDAIQSQLERAITVLKRDLLREQSRLKAAEAEAAARAAAAAAPPITESPLMSPTQESQEPDSGTLSPTSLATKGPGLSARRQSTISLSSLHRPPFPHKLDLSSAALRLNPDDPSVQNGMLSPVTLAPKSSISKFPPSDPNFDFGAPQDVDIDLTLSDDVVPSSSNGAVDGALGSSADKPIELDLDLDMDLFGDAPHTNNEMAALGDPGVVPKQEELIDLDIFSGLQPSADQDSAKADAAILAAAQAIPPLQGSSAAEMPQAHPQQGEQSSDPTAMLSQPSASMLEALSAANTGGPAAADGSGVPGFADGYDFSLELSDDPAVMEMQMNSLFGTNTAEPAPQT